MGLLLLQATWVDPDPAGPSHAATAATQAPAVASANGAAAQSVAGPSSSTRIAAEGAGEPLELRSGISPFLLCKICLKIGCRTNLTNLAFGQQ